MPFLSVLWQLARNLECKLKLGWAKGHRVRRVRVPEKCLFSKGLYKVSGQQTCPLYIVISDFVV